MNWQHVEPKRGTWNWSESDAVVGDLAAQGIRVLPVMWGSPGWVASRAVTPPISTQAQRDAWSAYLRTTIRRYGPGGNYWSGAYRRAASRQDRAADPHRQSLERTQLEGCNGPPGPRRLRAVADALTHGDQAGGPEREGDVRGRAERPPEWTLRFGLPPSVSSSNPVPETHSTSWRRTPRAHRFSTCSTPWTAYARRWPPLGRAPKPLWITEIGSGSDPASAMGMEGQRDILIQAFNALLQKRCRSGASERCSGSTSAIRLAPKQKRLRLLHFGGPSDQRLPDEAVLVGIPQLHRRLERSLCVPRQLWLHTLRDGRIVHLRSFATWDEAF